MKALSRLELFIRLTRASLRAPQARGPLFVLLAIVLIAFAVVVTSATRIYTSDDVAQQNLATSVASHPQLIAAVPQDNFVIKLPLYLVLGLLPIAPPVKLLVTALILNLLGFTIFSLALAARSLVNARVPLESPYLVPLVWLASSWN